MHNLDSQVMDKTMSKVMAKHGWGIPIHDAAIVSPTAASDTRTWYGEGLNDIHKNRKSILKDFFKSIGITGAAREQWQAIVDKTIPFEGNFAVSSMALK